MSFCVSSSKGVYAVRVRSVAHGVDDFITVPSRFLERNNDLVDLLSFIVQSEQRLSGTAGSYVVDGVSSIPKARLFYSGGRYVKYLFSCSLKKVVG